VENVPYDWDDKQKELKVKKPFLQMAICRTQICMFKTIKDTSIKYLYIHTLGYTSLLAHSRGLYNICGQPLSAKFMIHLDLDKSAAYFQITHISFCTCNNNLKGNTNIYGVRSDTTKQAIPNSSIMCVYARTVVAAEQKGGMPWGQKNKNGSRRRTSGYIKVDKKVFNT
jgi:hypothetical protein